MTTRILPTDEIKHVLFSLQPKTIQESVAVFGLFADDRETLITLYQQIIHEEGQNKLVSTLKDPELFKQVCQKLQVPTNKEDLKKAIKVSTLDPAMVLLFSEQLRLDGLSNGAEQRKNLEDEVMLAGTQSFFKKLGIPLLQEHCKQLRLNTSGTKHALVERLMNYIFSLEPDRSDPFLGIAEFSPLMMGDLSNGKQHPFKYLNKASCYVQEMCVWKNFLVSLADKDIILWSKDGSPMYRKTLPEESCAVAAWDECLVICSVEEVSLWTMRGEPLCIELLQHYKFKADHEILKAAVWNGTLITRGYDNCKVGPASDLKFWNKEGSMVRRTTLPDGIENIFIIHETLWTIDEQFTIQSWTADMKLALTLVGHTKYVSNLCGWGKSWIASSSFDRTVKVWNTTNGTCLFTLKTFEECWGVVEWLEGRLAANTASNIFVWNWDGTPCVTIPNSEATLKMLVFEDKLWMGTSEKNVIWNPRPWKIERLLWVALKKNNPSECFLAKLPQDVIKHIQELLAKKLVKG